MAGKKQHFIPQHFQKPFVIPGGGDRLWMFRRGNSSGVKVARKKAAAQEYFYSKPSDDGSPTLDDLVTEYENDLQAIVDQIRALQIGNDIDSIAISKVVAHLSVRSSHMRGVIRESILAVAGATRGLIRGELGDSLIELPRHHPPRSIYRVMSEELKKLGLLKITRVTEATLIDLLYFMIRERFQELVSEASSQLTVILDQLSTNATKISQSAQTSALQEAMAPEARIAQLSQLVWHVVSAYGDGVILPDCTSIAFDGREWKPLLFTSASELKAVALPLAPNRLAIGKIEINQAVDLSEFNYHAAQASYSFFLSNYSSDELEKFTESLGGAVRTSITSMTDGAFSETVAEFLTPEMEKNESLERQYASRKGWSGEISEGRQSFSVSLADFGDETFAKAVSEEIKVLIVAFSKYLPVSTIDGFTFAHDYKTALNSLDRGFEINKEITPTETEEFVGVGMPITIVSDGKVKTRVVLRSSVAIGLVSDNEECVCNAQSAVIYMLASGALTSLMANKFPQQILKPVRDSYEAFLYGYTSGVFEAYFCASVSSWNERWVENYERLALSALRHALVQIPDRRKAYRRHGDLNGFFEASALLITNVLTSLARMFGAQKACDGDMSEASCLFELLAEQDLDQWAHLFRKDLKGFDARLEDWADFNEIFFVHRHFERLMAHFGIVPDRTDGLGAYIHVPWHTDTDLLDSFK